MPLKTDYQAVAAGAAAQQIGPVGRAGDLLQRVIVQVVTSGATGIVSIVDGNGAAIQIVPPSTPVGVFPIELGLIAKNATTPGWKITTGAGATALAIGRFT